MAVTVHEIEAILRIKDELSGAFSTITNNVRQGTRDMSNATEAVGTSFQALGTDVKLAAGALNSEFVKTTQQIAALKTEISAGVRGGMFTDDLSTNMLALQSKADLLKTKLNEVAKAPEESEGGLHHWLSTSIELMSVFGVALSAEHLVEFAKSAIEGAAAIKDLSMATGVSTTALQQLKYVGAEFGVDITQTTRAIETFSAKLANGDNNAKRAVEGLGLSVKGLISDGPLEAFLQFTEAAGRVEDPMIKGGIAAEMFGARLAKPLLPMLGELRTKMEAVPTKAIISEENVKAAKEFDDAITHAVQAMKAWTVNTAGAGEEMLGFNAMLIKAIFGHHQLAAEMKDTNSGIVTLVKGHQELGQAEQGVIAVTDIAANRIKALRAEAMEPLTDAQKKNILELKRWGESEKDIAADVLASEAAVHLYIKGQEEHVAAVKKAEVAQRALQAAQKDSASSMEDLSGDQAEAIRWYHEQQTSVAEIVKTMEVYPQQVRQLIAADAEWKSSMKALAASENALEMTFTASSKKINDAWKAAWKKLVDDAEGGQEQIARGVLKNNSVILDANKEFAQADAMLSHDRIAKQLVAVDEWVRKERAKLDEHGQNYREAADDVERAANRMREALKFQNSLKNLSDLEAAFSGVGRAIEGLANGATGSFATVAREIGQTVSGIAGGLQAVAQFRSATTDAGRAMALANAAQAVMQSGAGHTSLGGAIAGGAISGAATGGALSGMNPYAIAGGAVVGAITGIVEFSHEQQIQLENLQHSIAALSTVRTSELSDFHQTRALPSGPGMRGSVPTAPDPQLAIGLATIAHNADIAGVSMEHLRDAYNSHDADALATAIDDINNALQRHNDSVKNAANGLSRYTTVVSTARSNLAASKSDVASITQALIHQQENVRPDDTPAEITRNQQQVAALEQQLANAQNAVAHQQRIVDALGLSSVHAADAIAGDAVATWGQMLRSGTPVLSIVQQMAPTLATLDQQLNDMGATGGEAFQRIENMAALAQDDIGGPVIEAVDGLGQTLKGLNDVGGLTQEQFSGTTEQITTMFNRLVDGGADSNAAMGDMQPALQTIWELVHDNHMEVDAQTAALLHQAEEAGIVGETHKDIQHQMLDALNRTADSVQILSNLFAHGLTGALDTAAHAADGVRDSVDRIPTKKDIEIATHYTSDQARSSAGPQNAEPEAGGGSGFAVGERWFHTYGNEYFAFGGEDGKPIRGSGSNDPQVLDALRSINSTLASQPTTTASMVRAAVKDVLEQTR